MAIIRSILIYVLIYSAGIQTGSAQQTEIYQRQFRFSLDDDFINIRGQGTDRFYTFGLHLDYYYSPRHRNLFSGLWLPKAGSEANNVSSVGISYMMFTPSNINEANPLPWDYPYCGAAIIRHSLFSYNPVKKYNFQSTISFGVMGPVSYAEELQKYIHKVIGDKEPKGWSNQIANDILLNFQFAAERNITEAGKWMELIGGARVDVGSMLNRASAYMILRVGKMNPWFSGFLAHQGVPHSVEIRRSRIQFYITVIPTASVVAYNSLLEGGIILHKQQPFSPPVNRIIGSVDYGPSFSWRNFTISFTETMTSPMIKKMGWHERGNISLYFSW